MVEIKFPLDLPDVRLLDTQITDSGEFVITVESTLEGATCHKCGAHITEFHGHDAEIRLRHLPILDRVVWIKIRPRRYRCPWCRGGPTSTQRTTWYDPNSPHTKAFDQYLLRCLINSTVSDVSRKEGVGYKAVLGVLRRKLRAGVNFDELDRLGTIGIDEIALRKGRKDFLVIVTSRVDDRLTVIGVLARRKKKALRRFLGQIPARLLATVESVCTDMWKGFTWAIRKLLPDARHVVDRFHVARCYGECADGVRKRERARLEKALSKAEYEEDVAGVTWLYRARPGTLEPDDQAKLERFFARSEAAHEAWRLRWELTAIFEREMEKEQAREQLLAWSEQARAAGYAPFCKTLANWIEQITNYWVARESSGFVEGLNNKLKVLKRRCYGLTNVEDFHRRLILDVEGPRAFGMC